MQWHDQIDSSKTPQRSLCRLNRQSMTSYTFSKNHLIKSMSFLTELIRCFVQTSKQAIMACVENTNSQKSLRYSSVHLNQEKISYHSSMRSKRTVDNPATTCTSCSSEAGAGSPPKFDVVYFLHATRYTLLPPGSTTSATFRVLTSPPFTAPRSFSPGHRSTKDSASLFLKRWRADVQSSPPTAPPSPSSQKTPQYS